MVTEILLSEDQVAERYGIHRSTLWRWVQKGTFPKATRSRKGCNRWLLIDIEDWEKRHGFPKL
ncbi:helix-turn-helix transcriptional regulator [Marinobacterium stanieri]|uniref:helix-turn-helix transcriptional regulator n=1 Tax=Marinobacterium stanieri TaxID=49186 RepID=UPI00097054B6